MSVRKGSSFERQVAKIFSDWSGVRLVRTPMSGAWEGCEVDIWPENPEVYWPLAIECKKSEAWNMDQIMERTGLFFSWIYQAIGQAKEWSDRTGNIRLPLLVFSRNFRPIYVAVPMGLLVLLPYQATSLGVLVSPTQKFIILSLNDFLSNIKYSGILWVINNNALRCEDSSQSIQTS